MTGSHSPAPRSTAPRFRVGPVLLLLYLLLPGSISCAAAPRFDAQAFEARYEDALEREDLGYFDELLSCQFWFGNQFPSRYAALDDLRRTFREYEGLEADLEILSSQVLPGGRSHVLTSRLTLRGFADGSEGEQPLTLTADQGSSVFVLERGGWRLYKAVEKPLGVPGLLMGSRR